MKPFNSIIFISTFILLTISSCKKDEGSTISNSFTYNGKEYVIDKYDLIYDGENNGVHALYFKLYSDNLEYKGTDPITETSLGNGHVIYLDLYTTTSVIVDDGTYNFSRIQETAGTFYNGEFMIFKDGKALYDDMEIEAGQVIVKKIGDTYKITFDCTDDTAMSIIGNYEGTFTYIDNSN